MTPKLQWRGVSKRFGGAPVLDGFDLEVDAGRSLVILGPSGAGKSVALKLAAGLLTPDVGAVLLDGAPLPKSHARDYGFLFQEAALLDSLSVWENVAFRLLHAERLRRPDARKRALAALDQVRLPASLAEARPSELSGGMRKRVGLARAIVASPSLLFVDEPTTGLDPPTAGAIDALIAEQVRRLGCTAVTITHDLDSTRAIADEVALLHAGRIAWRGPPAALAIDPTPELRRFVDGRRSV